MKPLREIWRNWGAGGARAAKELFAQLFAQECAAD
jgi:hypothetical protein